MFVPANFISIPRDCPPGRIYPILFRETREISSRCFSCFSSVTRKSKGARKYYAFEGAVPRARYTCTVKMQSILRSLCITTSPESALRFFRDSRSLASTRIYIRPRISARFGFQSFTTTSPDASNISWQIRRISVSTKRRTVSRIRGERTIYKALSRAPELRITRR